MSVLNAPTEKSPEEVANEIIQSLTEKGTWSGDVHNIKKDRTTFWCHANVSTFNHPHYGQIWVSVEVIGQNSRILSSGDLPKSHYKNLWDTILSGKVWKGDLSDRKKDGGEFWESASIAPIISDRGEITHFVAVKEDITHRKRLEEELMQAKLEAEAANRAKSEFLANMSHEIRTPLNAVLSYAQILQNAENLTTRQVDALKTIKSSGEHLLHLINEILDFSKIEAGRLELQLSEFHFPEILDHIADMIRVRAEQKGIAFVYEYAPDLPGGVYADKKRLRQVLINLLSNAVKFTKKGSVTFRVKSQKSKVESKSSEAVNIQHPASTLRSKILGSELPQRNSKRSFYRFTRLANNRMWSREPDWACPLVKNSSG